MGRLKVCPEELAFVEGEVEEYDIPGLDLDAPRVLDIGANIGAFGAWALERWPGARVASYEPHPTAYAILAQNVGGKWTAHQKAVVSQDEDGKTLELFAGENIGGLCLSSLRGLYVRDAVHKVPGIGAHHLGPCDVLKIDTEGSELPILMSYQHLRGCSLVAVEWHTPEEERAIATILDCAGLVCYHVKRASNGTVGVLRYVSKEWAARLPKPWPAPDPKPHLLLCVLGWKHSPLHTASREALVAAAISQNVDLTIHPEMVSGIERARSICTELFLRTPEATALGFIDSDIGFDAADVLSISRAIYGGQFHVVGAAYAKKVINWERVEEAVHLGIKREMLPLWASDPVINVPSEKLRGMVFEGKRLAIVDQLGTGFLFLSRKVIEAYGEAYQYELEYTRNYSVPRDPDDTSTKTHRAFWQHQFDPRHPRIKARDALLRAARGVEGPGDLDQDRATLLAAKAYADACKDGSSLPWWLTEDYAFCTKAAAIGFPTWCVLDATLAHQGPSVFGARLGSYYDELPKREEKREAAQ